MPDGSVKETVKDDTKTEPQVQEDGTVKEVIVEPETETVTLPDGTKKEVAKPENTVEKVVNPDGTVVEQPKQDRMPSVDNIPDDVECLGDEIIETYIAKKNIEEGKVIDPAI